MEGVEGIVDVNFLQVLGPGLLLSFLDDVLEGASGVGASCGLYDPALFLGAAGFLPAAAKMMSPSSLMTDLSLFHNDTASGKYWQPPASSSLELL